MQTFCLETPDQSSSAEITCHGAQVLRYKKHGRDILFLSEKAIFKDATPIRGGVPLCWPQFGKFGPGLTQHGFARNCEFKAVLVGKTKAEFELQHSDVKRTMLESCRFPHQFLVKLVVELLGNGNLRLGLVVKNIGHDMFHFTFAFHTYFEIHQAIESTRVSGLKGLRYIDQLNNGEETVDDAPFVSTFGKEEIDRIYLNAPSQVEIHDGDTVCIVKKSENLKDVVVWNPFVEKSKLMKDLGDEEYKRMICVECGTIKEPISVESGGDFFCQVEICPL